MGNGGAPRATKCRFCGAGGDLIKGAHKECKSRYMRDLKRAQSGYVPPSACEDCGSPELEPLCKVCKSCRAVRKAKLKAEWRARRRAEKKRLCACGCGRELPRRFTGKYFAPECKPKVAPKSKKRRQYKPASKITNTVFATRERPYAEPRPRPLEGKVIVPPNVEVKRIPPVGVAGFDFEQYRNS